MRASGELLGELQESIERLVDSRDPEEFQWDRLAGWEGLLREGLEGAVQAALEQDPSRPLTLCWELLSSERTTQQVRRRYSYERLSVPDLDLEGISGRLQDNACGLVATALAAVAARRVMAHGEESCQELMRWAAKAVERIEKKPQHIPPGLTYDWRDADPITAIKHVYGALAEQGGEVATALTGRWPGCLTVRQNVSVGGDWRSR